MDWKFVIQSIASHGLTQSQIAIAIGVKQPTIAGVLSGAQKDMRWIHGERLLALYEQLIGTRAPCPEGFPISRDEAAPQTELF